jgi:hypothetical protein
MRPVEAWRIDRTIGALSMHNHGTAVLDRPAEVTAPAQALLPELDLGAFAADLGPAEGTDDAAKALDPRYGAVRGLRYEELAVALNASGVQPKRLWSAGPAQLMEWAAQGLALLGIDRVRHYARRTCELNALPLRSITTQQETEFRHMWPRTRAIQSCHDAAYRLAFHVPLTAPHSRSGL